MTPEHVRIDFTVIGPEMYALCADGEKVDMEYKGQKYRAAPEYTGEPDAVVPASSLEVAFR